jgi:hypothetical protein
LVIHEYILHVAQSREIGVSINPMNRTPELTLLLHDSVARVLVAHRDLCEDVARDVLKEFPDVGCVTTSTHEFQSCNDAQIRRRWARPSRASSGSPDCRQALGTRDAVDAVRRTQPSTPR